MTESLRQDVRLAVRALVKDRSFTFAAIVVLALGIASTGTVFTLVNGALLRDMPFPEPDRIVDIGEVSYADLQDWRAGARTFDGLGGAAERFMNVSDDESPAERFRGAYISANGFGLLGVRPILGRDFRPDDERAGAAPVVMLGYHVWRTRYGSNPGVLGRTIRVNGAVAVIIGVMPEGFEFPLTARLWQPPTLMPASERDDRNVPALRAFGRLGPDVTPLQARDDIGVIAARLALEHPAPGRNIRPNVRPFRSGIGAPIVAMFGAMMGAVLFVLLIACANVANLLLARGVRRTRDISLRMSVGATRWQIVRLLLVESLLLALAAGVVALALSAAGIRLFRHAVSIAADRPPFWLQFPIDGSVFAFVSAVCLGTSILFGLLPALHASRTNLVEVLNEAGRGSTGHRRSRRWTGALVVGQLALTLVLLAGAGLMMRNLIGLVRQDAGVDTSRLVRVGLDLPPFEYDSAERRLTFFRQLTERLEANPRITASIASAIPLNGTPQQRIVFDGRPEPPIDQRPVASVVVVGPRYFETVGAGMIRGRPFAADDRLPGRAAVVVNQRFVDLHFGGAGAIGRRVRVGENPDWMAIVGVADNIRQQATESGAFDPIVYLPFAANPPARTNILVRADGDVASALPALRDVVRALDDDLALYEARTVDEHLAMQRWGQRVFGSIFAIFALVALVLAMVGLYAVTAYSVAQRTPEIGIRIALGARSRQIWWLVTRRVSRHLALGLLFGTAGAAAAMRVVPAFLAGTGGGAPSTIAAVAIVLMAVGLTACFIPARRAMRVDAVAAIRNE